MRVIFIVIFCLCSWSALADNRITPRSGSGGSLSPSKIYQVDYKCSVQIDSLQWFSNSFSLNFSQQTVAIYVKLSSKSVADAVPGQSEVSIFNVPFVIFARNPFISSAKTNFCTGVFFIKGDDEYVLSADVGVSDQVKLGTFLDQLGTIVISAADSMYPLINKTKPEGMNDWINNSKGTITAFSDLFSLLKIESPVTKGPPVPLRVGVNSVDVVNPLNQEAATITLKVKSIDGFIKSGNEKYISSYFSKMKSNESNIEKDKISISCQKRRSEDRSAGFSDDYDAVYLVYRRLLLVDEVDKQKIVQCMGSRALALQAVELLKKGLPSLSPIPERSISTEDVDDVFPAYPPSVQPQGRAWVAQDMDAFSRQIGLHLQGSGLVGSHLRNLTSRFSVPVMIEDQTTDYAVLKAMGIQNISEPTLPLEPQGFLDKAKSGGLLRWGCVQATRRDDPSSQFYDPGIDSSIIVLVAQAKRGEAVTVEKTPIYAVHMLFAPNATRGHYSISKMVFDDRYVAKVMAANAKCFER